MGCATCGGGYRPPLSDQYNSTSPVAITGDGFVYTNYKDVVMNDEVAQPQTFLEEVVPGEQLVLDENNNPVRRVGLKDGYLITPLDQIAKPSQAIEPVVHELNQHAPEHLDENGNTVELKEGDVVSDSGAVVE